MENIHFKRVEAVRALMLDRGWDVVVLTGSDPHSSEYPAPRWKQVEWVSGFTGEAGDLVITADHAGLWTDTRYFIQAVRQLEGTGIVLHKMRVPEQVPIPQWLSQLDFNFDERPLTIAVDGLCFSVASVNALNDAMNGHPCKIVNVPDMLDILWEDRPAIPQTPIITLGEEQVGESRLHKINRLRKFLLERGYDAILLTALDEIAWVLNVRASDIEYNPVVISYLLVSLDEVSWYVRKNSFSKPDDETSDSFYELKADGVKVCAYDDIDIALSELDEEAPMRLFIDKSSLNFNLYSILSDGRNADLDNLPSGQSPVGMWKSVKNEVEIEGMKEAHLEDGIAMETFLFWLEKQVAEGTAEVAFAGDSARRLNEWVAAEKLDSLRAQIPGYRGNSFETISAYGADAALPHYVTPEHGSAVLEPHGLYLVDSGGQYLFGTTDITRTVPLGECTPLEREDYTLVLKGHIDLARAVFPYGTAGCQLDLLARDPLWKSKRNFGHGTGHGVGFYLCVHEGPQDIRQNFNPTPMLPGMITSDEPGIYREGLFGVRHENLVLCTEAGENDFGRWLHFETLTLCHFDTSAIVASLMTAEEIEWLNAYNRHVFDVISPHLPREIADWLYKKTAPLR